MSELSVDEYIARQGKYTWRRWFVRMLIRQIGFRFLAQVHVSGTENIPVRGPCILMMNHISALDPVACLGAVTGRYVIPMSKRENLDNWILRLFIRVYGAYSVDRGAADRKALMNSIELVKSGQMILIAPEGTRHPEGLARPKDGLAYVAVKSDAVILPTTISDSVDFKQRLKRLRRARVRVTFGRPFKFKTAGRTRIPRDELGKMTEEAMYQLALTQPDPNLRGIYGDLGEATTDYIGFIDPTQ